MMRYADICAGISAATLAWKPLGWRAEFYSEIDKFPGAVLKHRHPGTPNLGDMTRFEEWPDASLDVLIGGTPCQGFSIAGKRKGLDDPRSNLALCYGRIAQRYKPRWIVWENVPGARSQNGGRDLGAFLGGLAELGYGVVYRSLDAQYAGLAQRRERLFAVGYLGDWRPAAAVLFEPEGLRGDPAPSRETGQGAAGTVTPGAHPGGYNGQDAYNDLLIAHSLRADGFDASEDGTGRCTPIIAFDTTQITSRTNRSRPEDGDPCHPLAASAHAPTIAFNCKNSGEDSGDLSPTLRAMGHDGSHANAGGQVAIAFAHQQGGSIDLHLAVDVALTVQRSQGQVACYPINTQVGLRHEALGERTGLGIGGPNDPAFTLQSAHHHAVAQGWAVRRLTPVECERLMGVPDNYTRIPWRGKPAEQCPDGPRYKALGNSIDTHSLRWIGERIMLCEEAMQSLAREAA